VECCCPLDVSSRLGARVTGPLSAARLTALERLAQLEEAWLQALHQSATTVRASLLRSPELMDVPLLEASLKTLAAHWKAARDEKSILSVSLLDVWLW
jgi:hypothetical protein